MTKGIFINNYLLYESDKERYFMRNLKRFCGFMLWIIGLIIPTSFLFSQSANDVIINEILNGSSYKDAVELLVTKPDGVDMRGWIITDMDSPTKTAGISDGYCTFPNNPFLQNVPQFTKIVLVFFKSTGAGSPVVAQDTVAADDSTLVLFSFGTDSLLLSTPLSSGVSLGDNDNLVLIAGELTSNNIIDKVYYGAGVDTSWSGGIWRNNFNNVAIGTIAYFVNDSIGGYINDNGAAGKGWTSGLLETNHTLGRVNPGQFIGTKSIRIRNITRNPLSPNSAQPIIISASVVSLNAVSSVKTIYYYDAIIDSVEMSLVSDSTYRDTIPALPKDKNIFYYIKATDISSNAEFSYVDSFTVNPAIRILQISRNPVSPDSSQMVTITAKISSFNPVASAKIFYTVNSIADSVSMSNVSDSTYQGMIPVKKVGDTVSYYVRAMDNAGQMDLSATSQYIVILPIVFTPIATIQANSTAYQNQVVTLSGIVVFGDYKLINTRRNVYLVDRSTGINGIQIFSSTLTPGDTLKRGDSVVVKGMILDYQDITEITHPTSGTMEITVVSRDNSIPPANTRSITQISDLNREGEWVRIKGVISSKTSAGGGDNIVVEDGSGIITVRVWATTGVNTAKIVVGNSYSIKGIVGIYSASTQLLGAYDEDFSLDSSAGGGSALLKVSPYPFNPMAGEVVRYGLRYGDDSRIVVRLFDVSGRLVTTLIDLVKSKGNNETNDILDSRTWNGRTTESRQLVPVGTYLMHLEVTNRKTGKSSTKTAPIVIGTKLK
jgi:hypothetical protein